MLAKTYFNSYLQYVTVIYNDEYHRFEDVIDTIPRSIDCERHVAIGLTTLIDRIGRVVVKCSGFAVSLLLYARNLVSSFFTYVA